MAKITLFLNSEGKDQFRTFRYTAETEIELSPVPQIDDEIVLDLSEHDPDHEETPEAVVKCVARNHIHAKVVTRRWLYNRKGEGHLIINLVSNVDFETAQQQSQFLRTIDSWDILNTLNFEGGGQ